MDNITYGMKGNIIDTTLQKNKIFKSIIDNVNIFICIWQMDGKLIGFNKYGQNITGFKEEEVLGSLWENKLILNTDFKAIINQRIQVFEGNISCVDGSSVSVLWNNSYAEDEEGKEILAISLGMDISSSKEAEKIINRLAYSDVLTGLPNRVSLYSKLESSLKYAKENDKKVAMLYMDLDNFKSINDSLGHIAGDELLKKISNLLQETLSENSYVSRLGGDEFVFLLTDTDREGAESFAKRVLQILSKPMIVSGHELYTTASIGITIYPDHGNDRDTIMKNADTAMYVSKEFKKNSYVIYDDIMNSRVKERLRLENDLRNAVVNNEFVIYYQPQINLDSGELSGVEALIRWKHPELGLIPPLKFIPIAEETGLIIPIGKWVLREACKQNKRWQEMGYKPIRVSVNISARQFEQGNLLLEINDILKETEMDAKWLELEITESIIMNNFDFAIDIIDQLKEKGIKVSLDDFGTGYSSLNYLTKLPINTLKIDKSFLDNVEPGSSEEVIAKAIIDLAKRMRLSLVAEGVENTQQLDFLINQGCGNAQGYLFGKPVSTEEFENFLKLKRLYNL